jgi:hypothetical protein
VQLDLPGRRRLPWIKPAELPAWAVPTVRRGGDVGGWDQPAPYQARAAVERRSVPPARAGSADEPEAHSERPEDERLSLSIARRRR